MNIQLPEFNQARVMVVGDVLLDRYVRGDTSRISPEAPVPIIHIKGIEERPGGAGNVALNITSLGGRVCLLGVVGQDPESQLLKEQMQAAGINCQLQQEAQVRTITKVRVLSGHQQLIRLDFEDLPLKFDNNKFLNTFKIGLEQVKVVILSDYGKGTLQEIRQMIKHAKVAGVPILVDPKGNFEAYHGAFLITPNIKEFEWVVGSCPDEATLVTKARATVKKYALNALLVTRGSDGMSLIHSDGTVIHLPAQAREVFDVTGAGDTVIGVLAAAIAAGQDLSQAIQVANLAASIVVGKVGASTTSMAELQQTLYQQHAYKNAILSKEQLIHAVQKAREQRQRIVMTNGCFDILHAGHTTYLAQAKALGDKLIVAVNDDASIQRLKGSKRPINSLGERMAVLAALEAVDWVIAFTDDTPLELIQTLSPDILVKGGDWPVTEIVGADWVLTQGGQVKSLPYVAGHSTTNLINKINEIEGIK